MSGGCWDYVYGYETNTTYTPVKLGFGYETCDTAAATAAKTAALSSYALNTNGIVSVKFTNAVGAGATLNINSKGAKAIYYRGAAITAGVIEAGDTATFIYSTYYHLVSIDRPDLPSGGTAGQVLKKTANGTEWADNLSPTQIQDAVDDYLDDHPTVTGTFTNEAKRALISLLKKVAYIDGNGQSYLDTLEGELFTASVASIAAVFTQGQNVITDTDSLTKLRSYLVVTATFTDASTATVSDYALSGTLTEGTSTITVEYGGQTATFTVNVTHDTTATIATSGYVLIHTNSGYDVQEKQYGGVTARYSLTATTVLYPAGVIPYSDYTIQKDIGNINILNNDTIINHVSERSTTSDNRWAKTASASYTEYSQSWNVSSYNQIEFSVDVRYLDDAYMYDKTTGKVFFAGKNTPYFGMSNVSEATS